MNDNFTPFFLKQIHALGEWSFQHARDNPVRSLTTAALVFGTLLLVPVFLDIGELPQLDVPTLLPLLATIAIGGLIGLASLVALPLAGGFVARFAPGSPRWTADGWALFIYLFPTLLVAASLVAFALNYPAWRNYPSWLPASAALVGPLLAIPRVWRLRATFRGRNDAVSAWGSLAWNSAALTSLASLLMVNGVQAVLYERSSLNHLAVAVILWALYFCALIVLATRIDRPRDVMTFVGWAVVAAVVLFVVSGGWYAMSRSLAHKTGWANFTAKLVVTERGCSILNRSVGSQVCRVDRASSTQFVCPVLVRSRIGSPIFLSFSATGENGRWPDHDRLRHASLLREDVVGIDRVDPRKGETSSPPVFHQLLTYLAPAPGPLGTWLLDECGPAVAPNQ